MPDGESAPAPEPQRGPPPSQKVQKSEPSEPVSSEEGKQPEPEPRTAEKQAQMDKDREARTTPSPVIHTVDNAMAGAGVLAEQKAAARKARK